MIFFKKLFHKLKKLKSKFDKYKYGYDNKNKKLKLYPNLLSSPNKSPRMGLSSVPYGLDSRISGPTWL